MIDSKHYFQSFASILVHGLPKNWATVRFIAIYYADGNSYRAYTLNQSGKTSSIEFPDELFSEIDEFRDSFASAGKPLWGAFVFTLHKTGKFNTHFDYNNCDEDGCKRFDAEEESNMFEHVSRTLNTSSTPIQ